MQISKTRYQFAAPALVLVVDSERARLFLAHRGTISETATSRVSVKKPEGRASLVRGSGRGFRAGAPGDLSWRKTQALAQLMVGINTAALRVLQRQTIRHIFLFAPQWLLRPIRGKLHTDLGKLLRRSIGADLTHSHPREIVRRLSEELLV